MWVSFYLEKKWERDWNNVKYCSKRCKTKKSALIWLRNDLRIKDHFGFYNAARNCDKIFAYFSFEPDKFEDTKWGFKKTEKFRTLFLIQTLKCLKDELKKKILHLLSILIQQQLVFQNLLIH